MTSPATLLERVRRAVSRRRGVTEKRMFGGHCFFVNGNMLGGVSGDDQLMIRVGPDAYQAALEQPFAREMDFTGRPMRGFVIVDPPGRTEEQDLRDWLARGIKFAKSLPAK